MMTDFKLIFLFRSVKNVGLLSHFIQCNQTMFQISRLNPTWNQAQNGQVKRV